MEKNNNILNFSLSAGIFALSITLLIIGRDILIPIAIAIVVWYLINALSKIFNKINSLGIKLPNWVSIIISMACIIIFLIAIGNLISRNISEVIEIAPTYQENFNNLLQKIFSALGIEKIPSLGQIVDQIDFKSLLSKFASGAAGIAANAGIIIIYVLFLLAEQATFPKKINALFPDTNKLNDVRNLLNKIQNQIQTYIWIKTLMSLLTGTICYIILIIVGLDLALFWAFVIFLLNYIPTIGSLLGIVLPSLLALVQFSSPLPFVAVIITLSITQFCIGSLMEPKLMGRTLNLSPLVVIITLVVWSSLWGIAGAILCVPITVIAMIVFSHFEKTKSIAIILSGNGKIN